MAGGGFGELVGSIGQSGSGGSGFMDLIMLIVIIIAAICVIGGVVFYFYKVSRWNIKKVIFRIPRDVKFLKPGQELDINNIRCTVTTEFGKGMYDAKHGVVFVKRKRKRKSPMQPFNVAEFLQSNAELEVVQVGAEKYVPVMPQSYVLYEDDMTKKQAILINLKSDISKDKPWKESFERNAKQAFSIANLLQQYQVPIMIGLVIILWGIQLFILYNKIK